MTESSLSSLWVDRIEVGAAAAAVADPLVAGRSRAQQFWSTPEREQSDPTREVMEVAFSGPRRVNHVTFDVAAFPHVATVEYLDGVTRAWLSLRYRRTTTPGDVRRATDGAAVSHSVSSSAPAQVGWATGSEHPQHHGPNHWQRVAFHVKPVVTARLRVVLARGPGDAPRDPGGGEVPYSLGVRDFAAGYRVLSRADVPRDGLVRASDDAFSSTLDYLGSRVEFALREQRASNVFRDGATWRCAPQPINFAVVNFYVDTRDRDGAGQVIDRFFIDPTTPGPNVNVYHSNDEPTGDFDADDDLLPFGAVVPHGSVASTANWLDLTSADAMVDIDNAAIQFDATQPWWLAVALNPQFSLIDSGDRPVIDLGGNTLRFYEGALQFTTAQGDVTEFPLSTAAPNPDVRLLVAHQPTDAEYPGGLHLYIQVGDGPVTTVTGALRRGITERIETIRLGGYLSTGVANSGMRLRALSLKQRALSRAEAVDFFTSPYDYPLKPGDGNDLNDPTRNAVLRFHPSGISPDFPTGLVGGPGDRYASLVWTPVFRDYALRKGYLHLPPTRARFFKFEFTHLVAEPYESFVPISRMVRVFSRETVSQFQALTSHRGVSAPRVAPGVAVAMDLTAFGRYADALGALRAVAASRGYTPTEALFVRDPSIQSRVRDMGWVWGFQPWLPGSRPPRFIETSRHRYETITIDHRTKVGFFVGLKALRAYRVDYLADDDTAQYVEHFYDGENIDALNNFVLADNRIATPPGSGETFAEAVSKGFGSTRRIRGVQFAAQQSDPDQLLRDDAFTAPDLASWFSYGDAQVEKTKTSGEVTVRRAYRIQHYGDLEAETYGDVEATPYGQVEGGSVVPAPGTTGFAGGIESEPINPSVAGRVYAVARVTATRPLTGPLVIQIVSGGGVVLAQTERSLSAEETTDIWVGYTVGSAADPLAYSELEGQTYGDVEGTTYASHESRPISGPVSARIIQYGTTQDSWQVLRFSAFDNPLAWSFSNDDGATWYEAIDVRNDPNAVLTFPLPDTPPEATGSVLRWRVRSYRQGAVVSGLHIRPWYAGMLSGIDPRSGLSPHGPNRNPFDAYPPIDQDPMWQQWSSPIPRSWFAPPTTVEPPATQVVNPAPGAPPVFVIPDPWAPPALPVLPPVDRVRSADDALVSGDEAVAALALWRDAADDSPATDSADRVRGFQRDESDSSGGTDVTGRALSAERTASDSAPAADAATGTIP